MTKIKIIPFGVIIHGLEKHLIYFTNALCCGVIFRKFSIVFIFDAALGQINFVKQNNQYRDVLRTKLYAFM